MQYMWLLDLFPVSLLLHLQKNILDNDITSKLIYWRQEKTPHLKVYVNIS